jgi:hypothetical protein
MRKTSLWTGSLVAVVLLGTGVATATGTSAVVRSGNLEMTFGESFAPKALSRTVPTPIALRLWSRVKSIDSSPPPGLSEFVLDTDENSAIDVRGLPICSPGGRRIRELNPIRGCGNAIVGEGAAGFDIRFPELPPTPARGKMIVYNDGIKAGVTTLYAYTYFAQPITTTLVMPIRIERIREGRFASRMVVTVPKIANGIGSLTSFNARIGRSFVRRGKRVSLLTAKCPTGRIYARAEANFVDGTGIQSPLARNCIPRD